MMRLFLSRMEKNSLINMKIKEKNTENNENV